MTTVLTFWVCLATHPLCAVEDDPTGPAVTQEFDSRQECEMNAAERLDLTPKGYTWKWVPRHKCEAKGEAL